MAFSRALPLLTLLAACTPTPDDTGTDSTGASSMTSTSSTSGTTAPTTTEATTTTDPPTTGATATGATQTTGDTQTTGATDTDTATDTATDTGNDVLCTGTTESTLPGVEVAWTPQKCVFTLAEAMAGIDFTYTVDVAEPVENVLPSPNDAGNCQGPGPSGLIVSGDVDGNGQHYCLCDQGLCPPLEQPPVDLVAGSYPATFSWNGVNWSGPSDTNNPFGPAFPPGEYIVQVRAIGQHGQPAQDFSVLGSFPITLVP